MEKDIAINFSSGIDTKTDPYQLQVGQFLELNNSVFQKGGLLTKRYGYEVVAAAPTGSTYLTTLNGNLEAIGSTVNALSNNDTTFVEKGNLQPCSVSVQPLVRNNLNQMQTDTAIINDLVCVVYTQSTGATNSYLYSVLNQSTGQNIVQPTTIPPLTNGTISGSPRVFVVGNLFVVVCPVTISGTAYLQYISIPYENPLNVSSPQNVYAEAYVPVSSNPGWDGAVSSGTFPTLVVAYNTTAGAQGVHVTALTYGQIVANTASGLVHTFSNAAYIASLLSICVDTTVNPNVFYITFYNNSNSNIYNCAVTIGFGSITTQFGVTNTANSSCSNLASCSESGSCSVFFEVINSYSYDSSIPTHYINTYSISSAGTAGSVSTVILSVGIASKAFILAGEAYLLTAYQSPYQNTYFLINTSVCTSSSPVITAKIAYQNGGGYLTLGIPSVTVVGSVAFVSYLFKQDVQALTAQNDTQQLSQGGIYSQLGVNLAAFSLLTTEIDSSEIANCLHLSGGYLSMFDGLIPVEHNFFLFPDSIEATYTEVSTVTPTGTFSSGSFTVTVSSASGVYAGMSITDTSHAYIPSGTQILSVSGTTLTISQATTHSGSGDNLSIQGNIADKPDGSTYMNAYGYMVTYEWPDNTGNTHRSAPSIPIFVTTVNGTDTSGIISISGPMLRLTQKVFNKVKVVIHRWSIASQAYHQVTSIMYPVINSTSADSWSFVDALSDSQISGNNLIYTTGGVVPDGNAPACNILDLFDDRLFLVSAEDPDTLWVSKTVVSGTPVEMSPLFTIYASPSTGIVQYPRGIQSTFPMDDKLLLFRSGSIYYITGSGPDNIGTTSPGCSLGNYSRPIFISAVVGCINQRSIVLTPQGPIFATDKGLWMLDRATLGVSYIGAPVERYNGIPVTSANVVPGTNFVLITLNNGVTLMFDYYYRQWGTWEGSGPIVSSCIYNGLHTILTSYGQILQQQPNTYQDGTIPVLMGFTTGWINLASLQGYQRLYEFYLLATYLSPHTLDVTLAYDYNSSFFHSSVLSPKNFSPNVPGPFGIPGPFGGPGQLEQFRVHAKKQLCQSFQITLQEVFDPSYGTAPGAGFTMSGITCRIDVEKTTRPIGGAVSAG